MLDSLLEANKVWKLAKSATPTIPVSYSAVLYQKVSLNFLFFHNSYVAAGVLPPKLQLALMTMVVALAKHRTDKLQSCMKKALQPVLR